GARDRHAPSAEFAIGLFLTAIALGVAAAGRLGLGALLLGCGATIVVWAYLQRRAEAARLAALLAGQTRILEMVATGSSLGEELDALCRLVANQAPRRSEGARLRDGAGPPLPPTYRRAIDGVAIGPAVGSCGSAAFHRRPVVVRDISTDPRWKEYRDIAQHNGLLACWSAPILTPGDECLGTFAMYYRERRRPPPDG